MSHVTLMILEYYLTEHSMHKILPIQKFDSKWWVCTLADTFIANGRAQLSTSSSTQNLAEQYEFSYVFHRVFVHVSERVG